MQTMPEIILQKKNGESRLHDADYTCLLQAFDTVRTDFLWLITDKMKQSAESDHIRTALVTLARARQFTRSCLTDLSKAMNRTTEFKAAEWLNSATAVTALMDSHGMAANYDKLRGAMLVVFERRQAKRQLDAKVAGQALTELDRARSQAVLAITVSSVPSSSSSASSTSDSSAVSSLNASAVAETSTASISTTQTDSSTNEPSRPDKSSESVQKSQQDKESKTQWNDEVWEEPIVMVAPPDIHNERCGAWYLCNSLIQQLHSMFDRQGLSQHHAAQDALAKMNEVTRLALLALSLD